MRHTLFSAELPDGRTIHIAPVSVDTYNDCQAFTLGDNSGYFIYETDQMRQSGIEILGKTASYDAAMRLIDILSASQITAG